MAALSTTQDAIGYILYKEIKRDIQKQWTEYFKFFNELRNAENDREVTPGADEVEGPVMKITTEKVRKKNIRYKTWKSSRTIRNNRHTKAAYR